MARKREPLNSNTGDGVKQYGISASGMNNSTNDQSISVSETNTWDSSSSYSSVDSHDTTNHISTDSHNIEQHYTSYDSYNVALTDSRSMVSNETNNSYSHTEQHYISHDEHNHTSYDSHNVTNNVHNIHGSFTSTGQVIAFGAFFSSGIMQKLMVLAMVAAGVAAYVFLDEILIGAAIAALGTGAVGVTAGLVQHGRRVSAQRARVYAIETEKAERRQMIAEQRQHELQLAALSRPVQITVNGAREWAETVKLLEDSRLNDDAIQIQARPQRVMVKRGGRDG